MNIPKEKQCTCCKQMVSLSDYNSQKRGLYGRKAECKSCLNRKRRQHYADNREKSIQKSKDYYEINAEERKQYAKEYRNIHLDYYNEYNKQYHIDNKESENERKKKYYHANKERIAERHRAYMDRPGKKERALELKNKNRKENWERHLEWSREWSQKQRDTSTNYAKSNSIRSTIHAALKRNGIIKSEASEILLGCKVIDAMAYLESFGYNRAIHDIDHIVPIGRFDMNNETHRIIAFNYRNMQPLRKSENRSKQDKLIKGWELIITNICKSLNIESIEILNHIEGTMKEAVA